MAQLNFQQTIYEELSLREMSLNQLAMRSGVSISSLMCWLKGSSPKISSLEKVLDSLGYQLAIVEKED